MYYLSKLTAKTTESMIVNHFRAELSTNIGREGDHQYEFVDIGKVLDTWDLTNRNGATLWCQVSDARFQLDEKVVEDKSRAIIFVIEVMFIFWIGKEPDLFKIFILPNKDPGEYEWLLGNFTQGRTFTFQQTQPQGAGSSYRAYSITLF